MLYMPERDTCMHADRCHLGFLGDLWQVTNRSTPQAGEKRKKANRCTLHILDRKENSRVDQQDTKIRGRCDVKFIGEFIGN